MKIPAIILAVTLSSFFVSAAEPARKKSSTKGKPKELSEAETRKQLERFVRESEEANQIATELEKEKRHPSKANLSGNWSTGPNLTGMTFQLEQDGEKITGRGFTWGCLGNYSPFKIAGIYRGGRLDITFTDTSGQTSHDMMKFVEEGGYPRFASRARNQSWYYYETDYELAERSARLEAERESVEQSAK